MPLMFPLPHGKPRPGAGQPREPHATVTERIVVPPQKPRRPLALPILLRSLRARLAAFSFPRLPQTVGGLPAHLVWMTAAFCLFCLLYALIALFRHG